MKHLLLLGACLILTSSCNYVYEKPLCGVLNRINVTDFEGTYYRNATGEVDKEDPLEVKNLSRGKYLIGDSGELNSDDPEQIFSLCRVKGRNILEAKVEGEGYHLFELRKQDGQFSFVYFLVDPKKIEKSKVKYVFEETPKDPILDGIFRINNRWDFKKRMFDVFEVLLEMKLVPVES
jgi:hypothetical protein